MALTVKIKGDATHFEKVMAKVGNSVGGITKRMAGLTMKTAAFGAALAGIGGGLAVATKFGDFLADSTKKAADLETLSLSFETLTGSASKAADFIAQFRKEAAKSPLSTSDYANAGKTLLAFGTASDRVLPSLKTLADVSLGNAERFSQLALAFAQTQASGRLMGQEVLQFVNAGFNPLQQISKKTGASMLELKKRMENGAISADMVTDAFRDATSSGGLFFGAIQRGANTTEGRIAKLADSVDSLKIAFGAGINSGMASFYERASTALGLIEGRFSALGENIGHAIRQSLEGNSDIFLRSGFVIGEFLAAGAKTALDRAWISLGTKWLSYADMSGGAGGLKNEPLAATFDRYSGKARAALADLNRSLPGGSDFDATEEDLRQQRLVEDRKRTEELIKLSREGNQTLRQLLQETQKPQPMFRR